VNFRSLALRVASSSTVAAFVWAGACNGGDDSTFQGAPPEGGTGNDTGGGSSSGAGACTVDAGPPSAADFAGQPDCATKTCTLAGTLGGQPVMKTYTRNDNVFSLSCGRSTGSFDAHFGTNGSVHADLLCPLTVGQSAAASTITVTMPMEGPMPGVAVTSSSFERFEEVSTTEVRFLVRCMTMGLGGPPVDGTLYGCCAQ